ncbi:O-antigen ligase family protein [Parahaliea mediterranea]|uniref:O-antigen ligase family protein n=1 Tax=Parahaliea mediterranea TaxID=651086 RepID=A0A939DGD7_9GAMM|nr:O-antigen ligase family protein [Parahaliea mediterranea]MBN7797783.1 O-antigen ligase family protein [Parahaliea mediterranea]
MRLSLHSNFLALLLIGFFVFEIDAYLYSVGAISVRPWPLTLVALLVVCFVRAPALLRLRVDSRALFLLMLFIFYVLSSMPVALLDGHWSKHSVMFLYSLVLMVFGYQLRGFLAFEVSSVSLVLLALLVLLLILDVGFLHVSESSAWGRPSFTIGNPNNASFIAIVLMVAALRLRCDDKSSYWNVFAFLLCGVAISATRSMGGAISYIFVLSAVVLLWINRSNDFTVAISRVTTVGVLFPLAIAAFLCVVWALKAGARQDGWDFFIDKIFGERLSAVSNSWELIQEAWLFGRGYGFVYRMEPGPHNMMLRSLVDGGMVGLFFFTILFVVALLLTWKSKMERSFVLFCGLLGLSLSSHNLFELRGIIILVGLVVATDVNRNSSGLKYGSNVSQSSRRDLLDHG